MQLSNKNHIITVLVLIIGVLSGVIITMLWPSIQSHNVNGAFTKNKILFSKSVTLKVGQSQVIHGKKGRCGDLPPTAEEIKRKFPKNLETGTLSTGKLGVRKSRKCGGVTPAREIIFTATKAGDEKIVLYDDDIQILVTSE